MPAPIAIQLYTVRDQLAKGFEPTIRQIAEMGYAGVETAGYPGTTAAAAAKLFQSLGLKVCSAHTALPLGEQKQKVLDEAKTLGIQRIVSGKGPEDFKTPDLIKQTCAVFNQAAQAAQEAGLTFSIHNHWWEFESLDGKPVYKHMLEHLDPAVLFELDVYWIQTGGCSPATVIKEIGARAPLLHIKDGPCAQGQPMTAVGDGKVDMAAVAKASAGTAEWMIVELDACATDMLTAVKKSHDYLVGKGLARGNKH
ncbi:MAG: sugar phosphate isomerase/epimerase [Verrucomicrobiota bacterium]